MTVSARLSRTLHETLGHEAAEDLVSWMVHMDASRSELRELCELYFSRTDSRIDARFAEFRQMMDGHLAAFREELHAIDIRLERRFADLLKWSFVFWVGAVGAVAALAKVMR